ncbi:hypothetical protein BDM02DRAFT_2704204 [Thelephora ganbajun]|uniref:Uncharacterized protein n=1 Tax=Thelephora ganbajun TaxID=370292 RepID=A0ACB6ZCR4_THEGA|nr:hypothetical protein BDM02DRAFT_2704204 [Thelephora ganbajun]
MSCSLPQEILDLIIDHLRDEPRTLKNCCIVSKAWVQRAQKHFFAQINFHFPSSSISRWRDAFPDPTNSPAHHARTLSIRHPERFVVADTDMLRTFCGVVCLKMLAGPPLNPAVSLVPFHGFSPVIRSLDLTCISLQDSAVFDLICSFPLLEDLTLAPRARQPRDGVWNAPLTSPKLTGSLCLNMEEGIQFVTRRLLDLPNGLHFTRIMVPLVYQEDVRPATDLVLRCSSTLEFLTVASRLTASNGSSQHSTLQKSKTYDGSRWG